MHYNKIIIIIIIIIIIYIYIFSKKAFQHSGKW